MVLTVQTAEVAARTRDGETLGSRMEVVERLFLDGVNGQRARPSVRLADQHTILVASAPTNTRLTIRNMAMMGAEQALYPPVIHLLIISAFHHEYRFIQ